MNVSMYFQVNMRSIFQCHLLVFMEFQNSQLGADFFQSTGSKKSLTVFVTENPRPPPQKLGISRK